MLVEVNAEEADVIKKALSLYEYASGSFQCYEEQIYLSKITNKLWNLFDKVEDKEE